MKDGRDVWYDEILEKADDECPAEQLDAEHPLYILYTSRLDGQAEGHPAHDRRLPDRRRVRRTEYVFDLQARGGRVLVLGRRRLGHRPLATSSTGRCSTARRRVMYEGAPDYPHKGIWWELCERYGVTIFYTAPTAIRACMKWGVGAPAEARPVVAAAARHGRRADQPEGVALVPQGDRRRALPDRRHLVADRDRRDHDHAAARASPRRSRARPTHAVPRHRRRRRRRGDGKPVDDGQGLLVLTRPVAGDAAHALQGGRPLRRDVLREVRQGDLPRRRRRAQGRGRLLLGHRPHRRRRQRLRPPALDGRGRVGDRRAPEGRRGGRDRPGRRGHRPGDLRVRDARGRRSRAPTSSSRRSASTSPSGSASSRGPKRIIWADDLPKTRSGKIMRRLLRDIAEGRELGDVTTLRDPDVMAAARGQGPRGAEGRRVVGVVRRAPESGLRSASSTIPDRDRLLVRIRKHCSPSGGERRCLVNERRPRYPPHRAVEPVTLRDGSAVRVDLFAEVTGLAAGVSRKCVGRVAAPTVLRRRRSRAPYFIVRPRLRRRRPRGDCRGGVVRTDRRSRGLVPDRR